MLLSAAYSQVELRILAHYSGDESLIEAFREGEDIHRRTAAEVAGIDPADVDADARARAKARSGTRAPICSSIPTRRSRSTVP